MRQFLWLSESMVGSCPTTQTSLHPKWKIVIWGDLRQHRLSPCSSHFQGQSKNSVHFDFHIQNCCPEGKDKALSDDVYTWQLCIIMTGSMSLLCLHIAGAMQWSLHCWSCEAQRITSSGLNGQSLEWGSLLLVTASKCLEKRQKSGESGKIGPEK